MKMTFQTLKVTIRALRSPYLFIIFLIILVMIGLHLRKKHTVVEKELPQVYATSPGPGDEPKSLENKEENEEDENDEEDSSSDTVSPWTLLNTALPARYHEPSVKTQTPSVALILDGLGLNETITNKILNTFKNKITLAFSPYSSNFNHQLKRAESLGYEILVSFPMESYTYPNPDSGPLTLLTGVKAEENLIKVKSILENIPKGTGIIGEYGSKFISSQSDLEPVLKIIKSYDGLFIDPNTSLHSKSLNTCKMLGMPCLRVDLTLPVSTNIEDADKFFKNIIQNAKENGIILIKIPAIPTFIEHLSEWIDILEKNGINLVGIAGFKPLELPPDNAGK